MFIAITAMDWRTADDEIIAIYELIYRTGITPKQYVMQSTDKTL